MSADSCRASVQIRNLLEAQTTKVSSDSGAIHRQEESSEMLFNHSTDNLLVLTSVGSLNAQRVCSPQFNDEGDVITLLVLW